MPDVFISYNREDRETARVVSSALEAEGFSVWWDAALRAGETYDEVTEHNLRTAGAVVVLWSKRSANSKWVRAEATVGERSSTLVPALIEDCERPIRFELVQTADLRHWRGDRADPNWRGFIQDVKSAISKRAPRAGGPTAAAPAMTSTDVSIETTFWNSIKDGQERSDFEAYLARYPAGHFAALAKNRLAALNRPASAPATAARAAAPPPQRPQQQSPQARPAAPPRPTPAPAPEKKSVGGILVFGLVGALAVVGVTAFLLMRGGEAPAAATTGPIAETAPEALPETPPVEPQSEPASDMLAEAEADPAPTEASAALSEPVVAELAAPPAPEPSAGLAGAYRDCDRCPLMTRLPGGAFLRGSPEGEVGRNAYEGPQREVRVPAFAIGVYEVTREEWNACAAEGGCPEKGYSVDGSMPALGVSFREGERYVAWLSKKTGKNYRLPSEAEWEYAARGGTQSAFWWGDRYESGRVATGAPAPVGTHAANGFGLHDVTGNAREWVADCYVNNYANAPDDGRAVIEGDCSKRVVRGGAWSNPPMDLRVANRSRIDANVRAQYMGLRVAASLD
ncbi:MAG: SUMF1/EgtB/PvdO family nonheme iron enzyme [Parvularculaceae bacterium]